YSNGTLLQRIRTMQSVWSNLRACLSPYKLKLLALKTLAWPRALYAYAVSVVPVGTQHYRSLRTGAMKGLRANRVGSNPVLHLATQDLQNDPEAWAIIQTFRDTREYRDPGALEAVLGLFADASGELPQNGPVAALWERIQRLGWEISPAGLITDKVGIEQADIAAVQTALRAYGASDQVFIRCMLDGTIFTQRARAKFQPGVTGQCKYCQAKDGFEHRMWQCQHFEECRKDIPSADMAEINALPACARLHGWHLQPAEVEAHFRTLQHPCASEPVGIQREVQPSSKEILHLFLDGTCAFPRDPTRRFAAWAVCLAGTEHTTLDSEILCGGWVSGLVQTSLRAEITAAVKAIKWAVARSRRVHLWSGCQVVVRRLRHLLQGGSVKPMLRMLICGYRYIIGCKTQVMDRLKSLRWSPTVRAESGLQQWAYLRNIQLVDQAAGNINFRRSETFWKSWQAMDAACQKHQRLLGLVWQVALRIAWKVAAQDPGKPRPTPEVQGSSRIE
ncbi:LINE-1 retrotransposable element ORF2 protein, partial [Durusdinium trenchii]